MKNPTNKSAPPGATVSPEEFRLQVEKMQLDEGLLFTNAAPLNADMETHQRVAKAGAQLARRHFLAALKAGAI